MNTRAGAVGDLVGLPGPPMTPVERRLAGSSDPTDKSGKKLCWNFNAHLGCNKSPCGFAHEVYKNPSLLTSAMLLAMARRNGFKRNTKIASEKVSDVMRDIRKAANLDKNKR